MSYDYLETGISLNGVPLEKLSKEDMIHLAEMKEIRLDCDLNDRRSMIALIDNGFLRIKDKDIIDEYYFCIW